MTIILAGLSHRTTPLALREKLYLTHEALNAALSDLQTMLAECVMLSTCNRLEIYGVVEQPNAVFEAIIGFLADSHATSPAELRPLLYTMTDQATVQHLLRVACGLDSVILGETQILGQIASAAETARSAGVSATVLDRLFSHALKTGKRARTETSISRHTTSISHAAAVLAQQQLEDLSQVQTLIIGAGEMAGLAARALQTRGAITQHIQIINRTYSKAQKLAELIGGQTRRWDELAEAIAQADLIITATGALEPILRPEHLQNTHPPLLIDIAVPRNIDPAVDDLPDVTRFDIDDLRGVVDENLAQRRVCVPAVEMIAADETGAFMEWLCGRQVSPLISDLRRHAEAVAHAEVQEALERIGDVDPRSQEAIERMAHRIINKLLHEPTIRLRQNANYAEVVRELFALGDND